MILLSANNANTVLGAALTPSTTTIVLATGAGALFPSPAAGEFFTLTLNDALTELVFEICYCTSRTGDSLTVMRGQEGTSARAWLIGDFAYNTLTAGGAALFVQGGPFLPTAGGTVTGNLIVDGTTGLEAVTATTIETTDGVVIGGNVVVDGGSVFGPAGTLNLGSNIVQITNGIGSALNTLNVAPATAANNAVNLGQFQFASGGIMNFPTAQGFDFMVEFGNVSVASGGSEQTFDFPVTFPHGCLAMVISYGGATPPNVGAVGATALNTVGFVAVNTSTSGGSNGCGFIAIGF